MHYLDQSMSLINSSIAEIASNRRSIMDLIISLQKFDKRINQIEEAFYKRMYGLERFVNAYTQFTLIIDEVKQATQRAVLYLENLRIQLNMLSLNHLSPSTISPAVLTKLLLEIKAKLSSSLELPSDPITDIWYFYRTLGCTEVIDNSHILMVINLSLLDYNER